MPDISHEPPEPRNLRFLRWLVIVLTGTMILGIATLVTLAVLRFPRSEAPPPASTGLLAAPLPDGFRLPEGVEIEAVTRAQDWFAIVTRDGEILIYDAQSGALRQRLRPESGE